MNLYRYILLGIYFILIMFLPIKSYIKMEDLHTFRKDIMYSSYSFLFPEWNLEHCFDHDIQTSCKEIWMNPNFYDFEKQPEELKLLPYEVAIVKELSPTHRLDVFPPKKNPIKQFRIYLSKDDLNFLVPRKIRFIFYEQQIFHINNDFRFPDQPKKFKEFGFTLNKREGWQIFDLPSMEIEKSPKFPKGVKQRWVKIVIDSVYDNSSQMISISEISFIDDFLYKIK